MPMSHTREKPRLKITDVRSVPLNVMEDIGEIEPDWAWRSTLTSSMDNTAAAF